jgi:hypothetical protein
MRVPFFPLGKVYQRHHLVLFFFWLSVFATVVLTGCAEERPKTMTIDEGILAYEFNPTRDQVYYVKREGDGVALFAYDVKGAATRRVAQVGAASDWQDLRGPGIAVTTDGRVLIKRGSTRIMVIENDTVSKEYEWFSASRIIPSDQMLNGNLNEAQRQVWADFYRARLADNTVIPYVTGFSEFPQTRYYLVENEDGTPIFLNEAYVVVNGKQIDLFDKPFHQLDPKVQEWQLVRNPNVPLDSASSARLEDAPNQFTMNRDQRGDCSGGYHKILGRQDCIVRFTVTLRDKTYRFAENQFISLPLSQYALASDGKLILHLDDKLVIPQ